MRIYSNFKDYYDIGLQYHDSSVVYERYTEEVTETVEFPEVLKNILRYGWEEQVIDKQVHIFVICGEVFYVLSYGRSVKSQSSFMSTEHHVFTSFDDFKNKVHKMMQWSFLFQEKGIQISEFVNTLKQLQFKYKSPIIHAVNKTTGGEEIEINAKLSEVEFQKVINPYQMYQNIEMFLANDLAQELSPPVKIDDKYKIPAHGFDKWSFRKKGEKSK